MKILSKCDDSFLDMTRIFYTVEIGYNLVADVMVVDGRYAYIMQNGDGSTVYSKLKGNDYTFPDCIYNEDEACHLALSKYKKEFKEGISYEY